MLIASVSRLLILTAAELTRDPRARRAALAARQFGLDVVGVCGKVEGDRPGSLDGIQIVRVGGDRISVTLRRRGFGGMRPSRPLMRELRGLFRLARLTRTTIRLAAAGLKTGQLDVVHANDFDTLPAAWLIVRRRGARLVYDSHELYTRQEVDPPRLYVRVVEAVEGLLARRAGCVVTSGKPYADELHSRLRLRQAPVVVLNCPERYVLEPASSAGGPLRVVYQAAMGPGRPLTDLLAAAERAPSAEISIRVVGAPVEELRNEIARRGLHERVSLLDPVPPARLLDALAEFEVGVIINRPVTLTDELVVPNKLFEYMMAGLAVVSPRLPGLVPFVEGESVGLVFEPGVPSDLGRALEDLAADRPRLAAMREQARRLALGRYNAEEQAEVLARVWATDPNLGVSGAEA
jgi:glycosyltransferase involved in cell wall biosynthesis